MNERIKLLAEQAWDATAVSKDFGHPVSFAEKLSELIAKECRTIILQRLGDSNMVEHNNAIWCCWGDIGDELGIER